MKIINNKKKLIEYNFSKKSNLGFTLIELMIAISIVGIFSSFLLVNFRSNEKIKNFKVSNLAIIDGIKRVQTMSLSGRLILDEDEESYSPDGYAWVIDKCSQDCFYQIMSYQGGQSGDGSFREIEKVFLNEDINIESEKTTIVFFPPRADSIVLDNFNNIVATSKIKMSNNDDSIESICVDFNSMSGRVSFVNCQE